MLKNIDFNKNRQRWKNYFCLFISFLFLIFFYVNRTTILENDPEFSSKFKIASIVLGWIVGVVLIFVRLDFGKKWNRVINILYILFAPCYIFFNMEIAVFNETYSFRKQHLSLLLFNFLLIGILELIFIVITKLIVVPLIMIPLSVFLGIRGIALLTLTIIYGAPTGVSTFQMAKQMDGDSDLAAQIIVFTSFFCIVTMFIWIYILKSMALI